MFWIGTERGKRKISIREPVKGLKVNQGGI